MPSETKRGSGISGLPAQQRGRGPKARVAKSRQNRPDTRGGPGGLGYVLGLDKKEQAEIDWHPGQADAKTPPPRR